ncbi:MAG: exlusion protein FxsA [Cycloclasticus sp. symbiont of Poecilosclerida sp. M]|nr:MAG: exlusion protein FxsA [Cycloclasticus sp. symbiont of Poecilosclerida sp. M]
MNPFSFFLFLLIVVPVVEIYFLIQVGGVIGVFPTILLVLFTAFLGAFLFRQQGLTTVQRVQTSVQRGEVPAVEMVDGVILLMSGALLLIPGFFTDMVGFLCLIPMLRQKMALSILKSSIVQQHKPRADSSSGDGHQDVIEGEFKRDDDAK